MSTISKEQLIEKLQHRIAVAAKYPDLEEAQLDAAIFKIALASLEAEAVAWRYFQETPADGGYWILNDYKPNCSGVEPLYTAPPTPVSVPECFMRLLHHAYGMTMGHDWNKGTMAGHHREKLCRAVDECRAAMLQGAEHVMMAYKLPDDFDFDRFNDVVWLEAVASNPHMHSLTTSTIAMVALELNKRLEAGNSPVIPDGWKLVPIELTGDMTNAMSEAILDDLHNVDVWRSVLAAAPQQEAE